MSVFEKRRADLNRFIKERPDESKLLSSWVEWWDKRKTHIFRAFKSGLQTPRMNMAETGHSTWVKAGAIQLTLVDAARHDVRENVRLEKTVQGFMEGSLKSTGKDPVAKKSIDGSGKASYKEHGSTAKKLWRRISREMHTLLLMLLGS